jgi:hypothetical protein
MAPDIRHYNKNTLHFIMNLYNHTSNQSNGFVNDRPGGNLNESTNSQDYFQFNNVSPEMIKLGLNAGQDILSKQTDKWTSGASGFWSSLKFYFSVSQGSNVCLYSYA